MLNLKNSVVRKGLLYMSMFTIISCDKDIVQFETSTLYTPTRGYFEWISTTTRRGKTTPTTVGYTKQMVQTVDPNIKGTSDINYLAFYKNNIFQKRYNETYSQEYKADFINNTLIVQYDTVGYLKWYVNFTGDTIQISEFLNPYNEMSDTIRSTYKRNSALSQVLQLPVH